MELDVRPSDAWQTAAVRNGMERSHVTDGRLWAS